MSVNKDDRKAYETGGQRRDNPLFLENVLDLFLPSQRGEGQMSDSETSAFNKGYHGEQLDGDKGGAKK